MTWFWFAAMIFFAAVEGMTVSMVSLWFAGGALVALIATLMGAGPMVQWITFTAVSVALLAALRPMVRNYVQKDLTPTNSSAVIGKTALVTERIDNLHATGTVKVNGVTWTARSADDAPIEPDTLVRIERIEGVKLFVSPAATTANR